MQLSKVQALQLTSISGGGLHGDHTHTTLSQAFKQEEKDSIHSHSLQTPMGQTKMTLTLTSQRVSVGTSSVILSQTQIQIQSRMSPRLRDVCLQRTQLNF